MALGDKVMSQVMSHVHSWLVAETRLEPTCFYFSRNALALAFYTMVFVMLWRSESLPSN